MSDRSTKGRRGQGGGLRIFQQYMKGLSGFQGIPGETQSGQKTTRSPKKRSKAKHGATHVQEAKSCEDSSHPLLIVDNPCFKEVEKLPHETKRKEQTKESTTASYDGKPDLRNKTVAIGDNQSPSEGFSTQPSQVRVPVSGAGDKLDVDGGQPLKPLKPEAKVCPQGGGGPYRDGWKRRGAEGGRQPVCRHSVGRGSDTEHQFRGGRPPRRNRRGVNHVPRGNGNWGPRRSTTVEMGTVNTGAQTTDSVTSGRKVNSRGPGHRDSESRGVGPARQTAPSAKGTVLAHTDCRKAGTAHADTGGTGNLNSSARPSVDKLETKDSGSVNSSATEPERKQSVAAATVHADAREAGSVISGTSKTSLNSVTLDVGRMNSGTTESGRMNSGVQKSVIGPSEVRKTELVTNSDLSKVTEDWSNDLIDIEDTGFKTRVGRYDPPISRLEGSTDPATCLSSAQDICLTVDTCNTEEASSPASEFQVEKNCSSVSEDWTSECTNIDCQTPTQTVVLEPDTRHSDTVNAEQEIVDFSVSNKNPQGQLEPAIPGTQNSNKTNSSSSTHVSKFHKARLCEGSRHTDNPSRIHPPQKHWRGDRFGRNLCVVGEDWTSELSAGCEPRKPVGTETFHDTFQPRDSEVTVKGHEGSVRDDTMELVSDSMTPREMNCNTASREEKLERPCLSTVHRDRVLTDWKGGKERHQDSTIALDTSLLSGVHTSSTEAEPTSEARTGRGCEGKVSSPGLAVIPAVGMCAQPSCVASVAGKQQEVDDVLLDEERCEIKNKTDENGNVLCIKVQQTVNQPQDKEVAAMLGSRRDSEQNQFSGIIEKDQEQCVVIMGEDNTLHNVNEKLDNQALNVEREKEKEQDIMLTKKHATVIEEDTNNGNMPIETVVKEKASEVESKNKGKRHGNQKEEQYKVKSCGKEQCGVGYRQHSSGGSSGMSADSHVDEGIAVTKNLPSQDIRNRSHKPSLEVFDGHRSVYKKSKTATVSVSVGVPEGRGNRERQHSRNCASVSDAGGGTRNVKDQMNLQSKGNKSCSDGKAVPAPVCEETAVHRGARRDDGARSRAAGNHVKESRWKKDLEKDENKPLVRPLQLDQQRSEEIGNGGHKSRLPSESTKTVDSTDSYCDKASDVQSLPRSTVNVNGQSKIVKRGNRACAMPNTASSESRDSHSQRPPVKCYEIPPRFRTAKVSPVIKSHRNESGCGLKVPQLCSSGIGRGSGSGADVSPRPAAEPSTDPPCLSPPSDGFSTTCNSKPTPDDPSSLPQGNTEGDQGNFQESPGLPYWTVPITEDWSLDCVDPPAIFQNPSIVSAVGTEIPETESISKNPTSASSALTETLKIESLSQNLPLADSSVNKTSLVVDISKSPSDFESLLNETSLVDEKVAEPTNLDYGLEFQHGMLKSKSEQLSERTEKISQVNSIQEMAEKANLEGLSAFSVGHESSTMDSCKPLDRRHLTCKPEEHEVETDSASLELGEIEAMYDAHSQEDMATSQEDISDLPADDSALLVDVDVSDSTCALHNKKPGQKDTASLFPQAYDSYALKNKEGLTGNTHDLYRQAYADFSLKSKGSLSKDKDYLNKQAYAGHGLHKEQLPGDPEDLYQQACARYWYYQQIAAAEVEGQQFPHYWYPSSGDPQYGQYEAYWRHWQELYGGNRQVEEGSQDYPYQWPYHQDPASYWNSHCYHTRGQSLQADSEGDQETGGRKNARLSDYWTERLSSWVQEQVPQVMPEDFSVNQSLGRKQAEVAQVDLMGHESAKGKRRRKESKVSLSDNLVCMGDTVDQQRTRQGSCNTEKVTLQASKVDTGKRKVSIEEQRQPEPHTHKDRVRPILLVEPSCKTDIQADQDRSSHHSDTVEIDPPDFCSPGTGEIGQPREGQHAVLTSTPAGQCHKTSGQSGQSSSPPRCSCHRDSVQYWIWRSCMCPAGLWPRLLDVLPAPPEERSFDQGYQSYGSVGEHEVTGGPTLTPSEPGIGLAEERQQWSSGSRLAAPDTEAVERRGGTHPPELKEAVAALSKSLAQQILHTMDNVTGYEYDVADNSTGRRQQHGHPVFGNETGSKMSSKPAGRQYGPSVFHGLATANQSGRNSRFSSVNIETNSLQFKPASPPVRDGNNNQSDQILDNTDKTGSTDNVHSGVSFPITRQSGKENRLEHISEESTAHFPSRDPAVLQGAEEASALSGRRTSDSLFPSSRNNASDVSLQAKQDRAPAEVTSGRNQQFPPYHQTMANANRTQAKKTEGTEHDLIPSYLTASASYLASATSKLTQAEVTQSSLNQVLMNINKALLDINKSMKPKREDPLTDGGKLSSSAEEMRQEAEEAIPCHSMLEVPNTNTSGALLESVPQSDITSENPTVTKQHLGHGQHKVGASFDDGEVPRNTMLEQNTSPYMLPRAGLRHRYPTSDGMVPSPETSLQQGYRTYFRPRAPVSEISFPYRCHVPRPPGCFPMTPPSPYLRSAVRPPVPPWLAGQPPPMPYPWYLRPPPPAPRATSSFSTAGTGEEAANSPDCRHDRQQLGSLPSEKQATPEKQMKRKMIDAVSGHHVQPSSDSPSLLARLTTESVRKSSATPSKLVDYETSDDDSQDSESKRLKSEASDEDSSFNCNLRDKNSSSNKKKTLTDYSKGVTILRRGTKKLSHKTLKNLSSSGQDSYRKPCIEKTVRPSLGGVGSGLKESDEDCDSSETDIKPPSQDFLSSYERPPLPPLPPFPASPFWSMYLTNNSSALTGLDHQESYAQKTASYTPTPPRQTTVSQGSKYTPRMGWSPRMPLGQSPRSMGAKPFSPSETDSESVAVKTDWKTNFNTWHNFGVKYIDTHCHLDFLFNRLGFRGNLKKYMNANPETFPVTFEGCVAVFCNPTSFAWRGLWLDVAEEDNVWIAMGCHPKMALDFSASSEEGLLRCLRHEKIVAVGEIGLDYSGTFWQHEDVQKRVFRRHIEIALQIKKPLVIHCRQAEEDCLEILKEMVPSNYKIHCHCFTGWYANAKLWMDAFPNLYIGLTPLVTFSTAKPSHDLARQIPLDKLLLETDAPYFIPRGIPKDELAYSNPGLAVTVAKEVAQLKEITVSEVLIQCRINTKKMYGI